MNKAEFVDFIAKQNGYSKADAERALDLITASVTQALSKGDSVNLVGFGAWEVKKRPARDGRNPKTGETMKIAAYNQPVFKSGKKLKTACN